MRMESEECIQKMVDWFFSDTIELFDNVLSDSIEDPEYSAITALNRFWVYLQYKKASGDDFESDSVSSLLAKSGYTDEDIDLFKKKVIDERNIYHGKILDSEFSL